MNLFDVWLYGIIPAFFIFGIIVFAVQDSKEVSLVKLTFAAVVWPFSVAVIICVFIGALIKK